MYLGQGSLPGRFRLLRHAFVAWLLVIGCALTGSLHTSRVFAQEASSQSGSVESEFRIVWGGGPARSFDATISIDRGSLKFVRNLSLQDDAVGTIVNLNSSTIRVLGHSQSTFGGVDLMVQGAPDSRLDIRWHDGLHSSGERAASQHSVEINELLAGTWVKPIDHLGSRVAIERQIRDRLRIAYQRQNLVFSPGESFPLEVSGNRTGLVGGDYRLNLRLVEQATGVAASHQSIDVQLDSFGSFPVVSVEPFLIPETQGVYEINVTLQRRRLINSLVSNVAMPSRKLELVVVAETPAKAEAGVWQVVERINPCESKWWEPLQRLSQTPAVQSISSLASFSAKAIGSQTHEQRTASGVQALVLAPMAWQAYPLRIAHAGTPHRLKVTVPQDQTMRLAISIQEPNEAGEVSPVSLDSGIVIEEPDSSGTNPMATHELVFWPRTSQPYVLLLNVDQHSAAALVSLEVEHFTGNLSNSEILAASSITQSYGHSDSENDPRMVALLLDKPLLAENFSASRVVDPASGRALVGWQTWFEASERLTEYAKFAGYNTVMITIATQGGAVYPSQLLQPSAKFDSGIFLSDGRSPEIKDLVELVCRHCDQHGLRILLTLELEGALPGLIGREGNSNEDSNLLQMDIQGRSILDTASSNGSRRVRYNPLSFKVQSELEKIVREVVERFGNHQCFGGIVLNLGSQTHLSFAGDRWGYDKASLEKFGQTLQAKLPTNAAQLEELFRGPLRASYVQWRAEQLTVFYKKIAGLVQRDHPQARLVLNTAKLLDLPPAGDSFIEPESMRRNPGSCLLACGLDCRLLVNEPGIAILRSESDSPLQTPVGRSWSMQLASDTSLDHQIDGDHSGLAISQAPKGFHLPSFEAQSPFGAENTRTWLFPQVGSPAISARQKIVRRMIEDDPQILAEGGWNGITGGAEATRGLRQVLKNLPTGKMSDVDIGVSNSSIRLRRCTHQGKTYVQLINGALWGETVELVLRNGGASASARCINSPNSNLSVVPGESEQSCRIAIRACDVVVVAIDSELIDVVQLTHQAESGSSEWLARKLSSLETLINQIGDPAGQQPLNVLGADFEQWQTDGVPVGWTVSSLPAVIIARDTEFPKSGASCLRIEKQSTSGASAWIQSDRIEASPSGRLAVEAWVRSAPGLTQPAVRLSLIGRHKDGSRFHRWEDFGGANSNGAIPVDWGRRPMLLLVPDLPSEDLVELRVAIDLLGSGKIWVDDIKVFGMYLHPDERIHLRGQMFLAKEKLRENNLLLGQQLLDSYWARYLSTYASSYLTAQTSRTAISSSTDASPARSAANSNTDPPVSPGWRTSSQPIFQQWRESMRQRWQR